MLKDGEEKVEPHESVYVMNAGEVFDDVLPTVITVADGETLSTADIAVRNDASLMIDSQFIISLVSVQLHTGL